MESKITVCIIGIYFGTLPDNFKIWLGSCGYNPTIDFLLITDNDLTEYKIPNNVKVINYSFEQLKQCFAEKLGFKIGMEKPYKLCDFRPTYGFVFQEYISIYDYWGYCDFDLVWGDLRCYIDKYLLTDYSKFLPYGHLSLYKNDFENNQLFRLSNDYTLSYKEMLSSPNNYLFDELVVDNIIKVNHISSFEKIIFVDIDPNYKRIKHVEKLNYKPEIYKEYLTENKKFNYKNQLFYWENGKIIMAYMEKNEILEKEFMYIHFQKRNLTGFCEIEEMVNGFYITSVGFIPKLESGKPKKADFQKFNPYRGFFWDWMEKLVYLKKKSLRYFKKHILKQNGDNIVFLKKVGN